MFGGSLAAGSRAAVSGSVELDELDVDREGIEGIKA
jgi:hypothetical protein